MARPTPRLDPTIHAPARLQLLSILSTVSEAEFVTLRSALEISDSLLSKHLAGLAEADIVRLRKSTHGGRRTTWVRLTRHGRAALRAHVAALRELIDAVE
jgi:DNA-binding MarR family transcriptional regulator